MAERRAFTWKSVKVNSALWAHFLYINMEVALVCSGCCNKSIQTGVLNNTNLFFSSSGGQNSKTGITVFKFISLPVPVSGTPRSLVPSLPLQSQRWLPKSSYTASLWHSPALSFIYKNPWNYTGPTNPEQFPHLNVFNHGRKSILPCKVTYLYVPGIRTRTSSKNY